MNKESGEPILLYDMDNGMGSSFDCGQLSNKVFRICRRDLGQPGVGEPNELNGYLAGTLIKIDEASNQVKSAIPGHADPDGHCLVHANIVRPITLLNSPDCVDNVGDFSATFYN